MTIWPSQIHDHPAREKIRYSGRLNLTDRLAHVKYADLGASGGGSGWHGAEIGKKGG